MPYGPIRGDGEWGADGYDPPVFYEDIANFSVVRGIAVNDGSLFNQNGHYQRIAQK
jgi:hypothetical protein